jgi:multimeric flavodoxin WrbA
LVNLYDLNYKGCRSCFACKYKNTNSYGKCALRDDLTSVLETIEKKASVLFLGTPIYFGSMTGEMRSFLERLLFSRIIYTVPARSLFPRRISTAMIYTMNATEEMYMQRNYDTIIKTAESYLKTVFGHAESYCCYDTCQFPDYSKVDMQLFDPKQKAERKEVAFPQDCSNVYKLGYKLSIM